MSDSCFLLNFYKFALLVLDTGFCSLITYIMLQLFISCLSLALQHNC